MSRGRTWSRAVEEVRWSRRQVYVPLDARNPVPRRSRSIVSIFAAVAVLAAASAFAFSPEARSGLGVALEAIREVVSRGEPGPELSPEPSPTSRVAGRPDALAVREESARALGIRTAKVTRPSRPQSLELVGTLAIDPDRLAHVHARFAGEVVELGAVEDRSMGTNGGVPARRPIRFGDRVEEGQLLAVLWSTDLGEKKSDFVDAISRLRLEQETLARLEALYRSDAIPERNLREARRNVEAAEIAVARSIRTLRAIRLGEPEIAAIRAEAESLRRGPSALASRAEGDWARVELRAPLGGTILEKNLAAGDIVDTTADLFKVADLGTLAVWAHAYEDDLPALLSLEAPIPWTVRPKSMPQEALLAGAIETIGSIIDPIQHTAPVMGRVSNPDGRLRAGEFVVATVEIPPPAGAVEIPIDALVEDGRESVVFVQHDPAKAEYDLHRVRVIGRFEDRAYVQGVPTSPGNPAGEVPPREGDRVVVSGAVELRAVAELHALRGESSPIEKRARESEAPKE